MTTAQESSEFELIVHIGTGKTGSSSIQKTLSASRAELEKAGVSYLGLMGEELPEKLYSWQLAGGWPTLAKLGHEVAQAQLEEVLTDAHRQLTARGFRRAIWSNETIFGNDKLVIPVLRKLEALGVESRVIVYLRRHDAWARSAYLQWGIKHKTYRGRVKSFKEWYRDQKINFYAGLKPWVSIFQTNLAVRNFDACGDVVQDFLGYFGLPTGNIAVRRENETPNAVALALWAIYNSQLDEPVLPNELQRALGQGGLLGRAPKACDFSSLLPTQEDIDQVAQDAAADRLQVSHVLEEYGQPPIDVSPLKFKDMNVSQGDINAALLMMIKQQSDQINNLRRKVADLMAERSDSAA